MSTIINKIKLIINKMNSSGFFSIFLSSVFSKVLVFLGSTIIVRVLSKTDYGIYAYVLNCISMLTLLNDWGASQATLQFLIEAKDNKQKKSAILSYSIRIILYAATVSSVLIVLSPLYYPFTIKEAKFLTPILFLVPILTMISSLIPMVLRSNMQNKKYAKFQVFSTFASYLFLISLSLIFGLVGAVISQYLYYIVLLAYGIYLIWPYLKDFKFKEKLKKKEEKQFLKFSISCQINNSIGGLLLIVDTFLIGLLIKDSEAIAAYKVGSAIPHALTFIYTCVTVYIMPHFINNNNNIKWLKDKLKKLTMYGTIGYGLLYTTIILLSSFIIKLIYGVEYLDTVPVFVILMIGLFFTSSYKIPCANVLTSMKKVKVNIIINSISVILNFVLNVIFIKKYGVCGAAISTTIINIFSTIAYACILNRALNKEKKNDTK